MHHQLEVYKRWVYPLLLILVPLLVLGRVILFEFVALDDELLIVDNPTIRGLSFTNLLAAFSSFDPELYVPLTLLTHQIEYSLFGLNPMVYHFTNLLLHVGSGLLLFQIFKRFFTQHTSLLLSLLFLVHPLQVEAVAWAAARKDLLAGFFFLLSLLYYLRFREAGKGYWVSVGMFLLALLSKVSVAPLPLVLIILDLFDGKPRWKEKAPYFALSVIFVMVAVVGKSTQMGDLMTPLLLSFVAIPHYLIKLTVPMNLSVLYPFTDVVSFQNVQILLGGILVLGVTVTLIFVRRKIFLACWAWFLLLLAPSFLNVAKGGSLYFASDRYMYLPLISLLVLLGVLLKDRTRDVVLGVLVCIFSVLTFLHLPTWKDSVSLFTQVLDAGQSSHLARLNLGGIAVQEGRLEDATVLYEQALAIQETPEVYFNIGQLLVVQGRVTEAIEYFSKASQMKPGDAQLHAKIGGLLLMQGLVNEALSSLSRADELDPNIASVHYNLGLIYEHLGERPRATEEFQAVLKLRPDDVQAREKLGLL